ncbi:MAG TPA: hypothetical protein VFQ27_14640 [Xanthobacteraceae bacterium]|nr:hypothetical protein [Xanthobacteraceae bacterium]
MSSSAPDAVERLKAAAAAAFESANETLATDATDRIPDMAVQQLLTVGIRLIARKMEMERRYISPLTAPDAVTATEGAMLMTELMRAVDLNLFDLSMWASRPRDDEQESEPVARG